MRTERKALWVGIALALTVGMRAASAAPKPRLPEGQRKLGEDPKAYFKKQPSICSAVVAGGKVKRDGVKLERGSPLSAEALVGEFSEEELTLLQGHTDHTIHLVKKNARHVVVEESLYTAEIASICPQPKGERPRSGVQASFLPWKQNGATYTELSTKKAELFLTVQLSGCFIYVLEKKGKTPILIHTNSNAERSNEKNVLMKVALARQIQKMEQHAGYKITRALVSKTRKSAFKEMAKRQPWLKKTKVTYYDHGGCLCFGVRKKKKWRFLFQTPPIGKKQKFSVKSW